jgi:hypothetical protein
MEFSVRLLSPPNTYSYVRVENLGSTRKFVEIYLLFTCITNLILALKKAEFEWAGGTFLRQRNKVPPAHVQRVYLLGKGLVPPEKPNALLILINCRMHHPNTSFLWCHPNQFTCKFKQKCLHFFLVSFIIGRHGQQEPSIASPLTELHILVIDPKCVACVRIMKNKTFILLDQACLCSATASFVLLASSSQSSTHV